MKIEVEIDEYIEINEGKLNDTLKYVVMFVENMSLLINKPFIDLHWVERIKLKDTLKSN